MHVADLGTSYPLVRHIRLSERSEGALVYARREGRVRSGSRSSHEENCA